MPKTAIEFDFTPKDHASIVSVGYGQLIALEGYVKARGAWITILENVKKRGEWKCHLSKAVPWPPQFVP